ncbi:hypothetical protein NPIL_613651 [Nephila pilipes]|uniref:Uncharacterized protein n=1 Tax=Nephila pilipes TaxID=299642 RepID=A0A8X6QQV1_NEPPI|nr:hypothetical protein NPIL_613651 [Nephila pilipes]
MPDLSCGAYNPIRNVGKSQSGKSSGSLEVIRSRGDATLRISLPESSGNSICSRRNKLSADLAKRYFSYSFSRFKEGQMHQVQVME